MTQQRVIPVLIGGLLLLLVVVVWRAFDLVRDNRRFNPVTKPGQPDPRGFLFIEVDPVTGRPARYNPCRPIAYVVNLDGAPASAAEDAREAAALAAEATGIQFVFEGAVTEVPSLDRESYLPDLYGSRWPPVLIGWVPSSPEVFRQHDVAIAASDVVENGDGELVYVTGTMVLNGSRQLSAGFAAGQTWGKVILHEWGHILGLDHVDDPTQVMHSSLVSSPARWGAGDAAGLRELGRSAGCLDDPEFP